MFADRHELDVREVEIARVIREHARRLAVAVVRAVAVTAPRAEMDLVTRDGFVQPIPMKARRHPRAIRPTMRARRDDDRCRSGTRFVSVRERIGLDEDGASLAVAELELVERACRDAGHEQLPNAGRAAAAHRMAPSIPAVEV